MIRRFVEWFTSGIYTDKNRADRYHAALDRVASGIFVSSWPELSERLKQEILRQIQASLPFYRDSVYLRLTDSELVKEFHRTIGRRFMIAYGVKRKTIKLIASEAGATANCRIRLSAIDALRRFPDVALALEKINSGGTGDQQRAADSA